MLRLFIKKIIPKQLRKVFGSIIDKHPILFLPIIMVTYGVILIPRKDCMLLISLFPKEKIYVHKKRNGWDTFYEIFREKIYDNLYKIKHNDVVIDVGAHIGLFTIKASKCCKNGLVVAIEPDRENFRLLKKNSEKLSNVITINKAVGDHKGFVKLYLAKSSDMHSTKVDFGEGYIYVELDTLDNIVDELKLTKVDLIKIDTEGAEVEVLNGAYKTLDQFTPRLIIEFHSEDDKNRISSMLVERGYKVEIIQQDLNLGLIYAYKK